jgi:hypothetical protein
MTITGKRHDFRIDYDVGFDDDGRILGLDVMLASRCGYSVDFSGPVNDRAVLHIDNCYHLPNLHVVSHRCKTNTQSSTAFRGFGGPQGMFGIETVIEAIARSWADPLDVRRVNLYRDPADSGDAAVDDHALRPGDRGLRRRPAVLLAELEAESGYARRADIDAFNAASRTRKKGLAIVPLKFGISFTATMLNQGGALVHDLPGRHVSEPRRHRDGPGPEHQDGAGGRRRPGHAGGAGARDGHRHAEGAQRQRHRGQQRRRHQRRRHQQRLRPAARAPGAGGARPLLGCSADAGALRRRTPGHNGQRPSPSPGRTWSSRPGWTGWACR